LIEGKTRKITKHNFKINPILKDKTKKLYKKMTPPKYMGYPAKLVFQIMRS